MPLGHFVFFPNGLCRVLTPYYTEEVLFSMYDLDSPNEDGVSILFYLQKIFPGFSLAHKALLHKCENPRDEYECISCHFFVIDAYR